MLFRFSTIHAALLGAAVFILGAGGASASHDISGTWDAQYNLTCDVVVQQEGAALTADVDCGAAANGTLDGTYDADTGAVSLSGASGLITISLDGTIVDDTISGTFSALPLADDGTFEAVRAEPASGAGLDGAWTITLLDVFSGGCTLRLDQTDTALAGVLACDAFDDVALDGTYDGGTITLIGELRPQIPVSVEGAVSEDGASVEGTWQVGPSGAAELTGSFSGTLRGGPHPTEAPSATSAPNATPLPELPSTGAGPATHTLPVTPVALLATLGVAVLAAGTLLRRRSV